MAKARQKNLNKVAKNLSEKPRQVLASDINSISGESIRGKKYWLLVVDQYTSMKWSFFLNSKDKQPKILDKFVMEISNIYNVEPLLSGNQELNQKNIKKRRQLRSGTQMDNKNKNNNNNNNKISNNNQKQPDIFSQEQKLPQSHH